MKTFALPKIALILMPLLLSFPYASASSPHTLTDLSSYIDILLGSIYQDDFQPLDKCTYPFQFQEPSMPYSVTLSLDENSEPIPCGDYQGVVMTLDGARGETVLPTEDGLSEFVRGYTCSNGWEIFLSLNWSHAYVNHPDCNTDSFVSRPELYRNF